MEAAFYRGMSPRCLHHEIPEKTSDESRIGVVLNGFFVRKSDGVQVQRYRCLGCKKSFSKSTFEDCYWQKKRHINTRLLRLLVGGFSQRRSAFELCVNRKTVVRKFIFMGVLAKLRVTESNGIYPKATTVEFDDLETVEHSKFKPLSVTVAVESKSRRVLGFEVSQMPAKGLLAARSRKKYGKRCDERKPGRIKLFQDIQQMVAPGAIIKSDDNPHYACDVEKHFPSCQYKTYKGRRGCVVGQGELKRGGFDPLFTLNHTLAMFRANINRLFRRTWNTTKKKDRLGHHIALYVFYHNEVLLKSKGRSRKVEDNIIERMLFLGAFQKA